jgi:hypothetical protein
MRIFGQWSPMSRYDFDSNDRSGRLASCDQSNIQTAQNHLVDARANDRAKKQSGNDIFSLVTFFAYHHMENVPITTTSSKADNKQSEKERENLCPIN